MRIKNFKNDVSRVLMSGLIFFLFAVTACGGGDGGSGGGGNSSDPEDTNIPVTVVSAFGDNGVSSIQIGRADESINSIEVTADGNIIAGGYIKSYLTKKSFLLCIKSDGSLDSSFGNNGTVEQGIGTDTRDNEITDIAVQSDGKIIATGYYDTSSTNTDVFLVRYNVNGTADTGFGVDGVVKKQIGGVSSDDCANSVRIQTDGKILITGYTHNGSNYDVFVCRFNSDGSIDTGFGTNGVVKTDIGAKNNVARDIAVQSDNKIIVAGYHYNGSNNDMLVIRYTSSGVLDTTFDSDGYVYTSIGAGHDEANSVYLYGDKIYVAGSSVNGTDIDAAYLCYSSGGVLDGSFDTDGKATVHTNSAKYYINSIAFLSDGKIISTGKYVLGTTTDVVIIKLNTDGSTDNTFDSDGVLLVDTGYNESSSSLKILSDNSIIVAGDEDSYDNISPMIKKLSSSGLENNTFKDNCKLGKLGKDSDRFDSIAEQSDGKIIVGGYAESGVIKVGTIVRFAANGLIDQSFGVDGIVYLKKAVGDLLVLNDDKILTASSLNGHLYLELFSKDGEVLTSFGTSGKYEIISIAETITDEYGINLAVQDDGKIIVTGDSGDFITARVNTNGTLDTTFGINGYVKTDVGGMYDEPKKILIQNDGKIIVAGDDFTGGFDYEGAIVRYDTNGNIDTSFGTSGIVKTGTPHINNVIFSSENKIIVSSETSLLRYNSDGTLDNSFGIDGSVKMTNLPDEPTSYVYSLVEQSDGRLMISGVNYYANAKKNDSFIACFTATGSVDSTFGDGGYYIIKAFDAVDIYGMILTNDDLLLCGYSYKNNDWDSTLIKLTY